MRTERELGSWNEHRDEKDLYSCFQQSARRCRETRKTGRVTGEGGDSRMKGPLSCSGVDAARSGYSRWKHVRQGGERVSDGEEGTIESWMMLR